MHKSFEIINKMLHAFFNFKQCFLQPQIANLEAPNNTFGSFSYPNEIL